MSKIRLTSDGLIDVDFTGIRLTSCGLVKGSPLALGNNPVAVNDAYDVSGGTELVVSAATGILANDTYRCGIIQSFDSAFSTAFNGA